MQDTGQPQDAQPGESAGTSSESSDADADADAAVSEETEVVTDTSVVDRTNKNETDNLDAAGKESVEKTDPDAGKTETGEAQEGKAPADKAAASSDKAAGDAEADKTSSEKVGETEPAVPVEAPGWHDADDGSRYYVGEGGSRLTGEQMIDGAWYYLDPERDGAASTGLVRQEVSSGSGSFKLAYYGEDGARLTGLQSVGGQTYFFDATSGAMQTGFQRIGGNTYYFSPDGGAKQYGIQGIGGSWYYFDPQSGAMQTGQQYVAGAWRFYDPADGHLLTPAETIRRVLDVAFSWVGTPDSETWRFQNEVADAGGHYCEHGPCYSMIWHFFRQAGMDRFLADGLVTGWPHESLDWMRAHGAASATPQVGEIVYFWHPQADGWSDGLSASHAELVVGFGDGWVSSIGAITGGVQVRYWDYSHIVGFGRPAYF